MNKRKTLMLSLLTCIFIIPMVGAWLAFSKGYFITGSTTNHGTLLKSPIALSTLGLTNQAGLPMGNKLSGKWWLLYITANAQDPLAQRNLYFMRQIRQATGKNRDRVEVAIASFALNPSQSHLIAKGYPNTYQLLIPSTKLALFESNTKKLALTKGSLYLVDPLGNIMMVYAPDAAPKGILKDLERVLKVSQIG